MANTQASQQKEEAKKFMEQKEGSIASRLRSRFKIGDANTFKTEKKGPTTILIYSNEQSLAMHMLQFILKYLN